MVVSKVLKLKIAYFREMRTEINGGGSELKHVLQNPGALTTIIALALSHSSVNFNNTLQQYPTTRSWWNPNSEAGAVAEEPENEREEVNDKILV